MQQDYQLCLGTGRLTYSQLRELHEHVVACRGYGLRCLSTDDDYVQEYWAVAPHDANTARFRSQLLTRLKTAGLARFLGMAGNGGQANE